MKLDAATFYLALHMQERCWTINVKFSVMCALRTHCRLYTMAITSAERERHAIYYNREMGENKSLINCIFKHL